MQGTTHIATKHGFEEVPAAVKFDRYGHSFAVTEFPNNPGWWINTHIASGKTASHAFKLPANPSQLAARPVAEDALDQTRLSVGPEQFQYILDNATTENDHE